MPGRNLQRLYDRLKTDCSPVRWVNLRTPQQTREGAISLRVELWDDDLEGPDKWTRWYHVTVVRGNECRYAKSVLAPTRIMEDFLVADKCATHVKIGEVLAIWGLGVQVAAMLAEHKPHCVAIDALLDLPSGNHPFKTIKACNCNPDPGYVPYSEEHLADD